MHVLEVLDDDLGVEFATVAVVAIIAMSVRILFASHVRCWTVGSLPYLFCHSATCASASFSGNLASLSNHSPWNPTTHPSKSSGFKLKLVALVNPRSKGPKTPAGVCRNSLSFKRSRVRYSWYKTRPLQISEKLERMAK
jgi:hypothetical protein